MAGERALPGLGLTGFWDKGDSTWKAGMDNNLRVLSALVSRGVVSATTALPAAGSTGDIYIVPASATTSPNHVAVWDGPAGAEAWVYLTPKEGWTLYARDTDTELRFDGTGWVDTTPAPPPPPDTSPVFNAQTGTAYSLVDADLDGRTIVEMDNAAANTVTVPAGLTGTGPVSFAQAGAGQTSFAAATGVTIRSAAGLKIGAQFGTATLIPRGADTYYLTGNLVA